MFTFKHSARVVRGALLLASALSFGAASSLLSQQAQSTAPAPAVTAPVSTAATTATPAPAASALFAPAASEQPTIAAAQTASDAVVQENHTIVVSTLALVLGIILLVVLID